MRLGENQNKINYIHCHFYKQVIQKFSEVKQLNVLHEQQMSLGVLGFFLPLHLSTKENYVFGS